MSMCRCRPTRVHVGKVSALVAGMVAGADSIDDMAVLRHGALPTVFDRPYAPSTLGSFLRSFTFGHVRQLDAVATRFLCGFGRTDIQPARLVRQSRDSRSVGSVPRRSGIRAHTGSRAPRQSSQQVPHRIVVCHTSRQKMTHYQARVRQIQRPTGRTSRTPTVEAGVTASNVQKVRSESDPGLVGEPNRLHRVYTRWFGRSSVRRSWWMEPSKCREMEPMTGIEPAYSAWEADVLPLNYIGAHDIGRP